MEYLAILKTKSGFEKKISLRRPMPRLSIFKPLYRPIIPQEYQDEIVGKKEFNKNFVSVEDIDNTYSIEFRLKNKSIKRPDLMILEYEEI